MIRVGLFIDTYNIGGAETVVLNLGKQLLKESGYEPVVMHFNSDVIKEKCQQFNIPEVSIPAIKYYKKIHTVPVFSIILKKFIQQCKIDVLHSHLFGPIIAGSLAAKLANIPHIGTLHDIYTIEEKPARIWLLKLASLLNTKIITVSQQMEGFYKSRGNFKAEKIKTIYNGVAISAFKNLPKKDIRQTLNIDKEEIVIVCVARLVQLKRHDVLIKAFSKINSNQKNKLLIVGNGPERQQLEALVKTLSLTDNILFLGERNDIPEILNESDIYTLTSDTEGLSCSILEAMAAGLPIVATNVGGNSELVIEGKNGFLIEMGSIEKTAIKLQDLIEANEIRLSFGAESSKIVSNLFNWEETFDKYSNLYKL